MRALLIVLAGVGVLIAGCGASYESTPLRHPVRANARIAVEDFTADSPATARMIWATFLVELEEAGFVIGDVAPDLIIRGTITKVLASYEGDYVDSVFIIVATPNNDIVTSIRFNQGYRDKTPGNIGTEIGKRIVRILKKE